MPSAGLIGYQWRRHGGCSGLSQEDYFATLRSAREAVDIPVQYQRPSGETDVDPDAVEQAFLASNPGLPSDAISISCDDNYLREVRICMTKQLAFRACPALEKRSCRAKQIAMPPVSGG